MAWRDLYSVFRIISQGTKQSGLALHHYNFNGLFSLTTNVPYFEGLLHAFRNDQDANIKFQFILDDDLEVKTKGKPRINLMLYHDADSNAVDFYYPWLRPISARLIFGHPKSSYEFRFNKNYMRFSNFVAEGWEIIDVFRSLLMIGLIQSDNYMIHGAALRIGEEGVLIPSFGNTGKTTTSWLLARGGAEFLTDEFAIVNSDGECLGFPCSSLLSPSLVTEIGLKLSKTEMMSLRLNEFKSRILTTRFAPGGMKVYPDQHFKLCEKTQINRMIFIQNGIDHVQEVNEERAIAMLKAIQRYELNWSSNPYIIAQSFFQPNLDVAQLSSKEDDLIRNLVAKVKQCLLVSSSSAAHFTHIAEIMND